MEQHSLYLSGMKKLEWKVEDIVPLHGDEIRIRTIAAAISIGAELPIYNESDITKENPIYPRKMGYESYGEVIETGANVKSFSIGDRVVASYGQKTIGVAKETNAIPIPKHIHFASALLTILSCDAAKGVLKLNPQLNHKIIITGMGTMGLLSEHFLKNYLRVRQVDIVEPDAQRREIAKLFGVNHTFDVSEAPENVYDFGLECSSRNKAFETLQKSVVKDGAICILSDGNNEPFVLQPDFYEKELRIVGSSDGWDYHEHSKWFFGCVESTPYIENIFQHKITRHELIECFEQLSAGEINPIKVLVLYE
ncbi:alcohol dehydrogenase catalytic domain-containing protein [Paenibacillus alkalitolerans]|uniref:alcohol dehydrogenase catalytic domain-containing protein n=1 Tax=Paenibacillus alkalitolerans TaxID=2799335 RepID=UPI0018F5DA77|nr:alcohol dehydrogenase catalytic domain-containing protein [Paenibacillus alkalitolerans]